MSNSSAIQRSEYSNYKVNYLISLIYFIKLKKLRPSKYGNIIWCPKFHCELNPIEGMWCNSKRHLKEQNNKDFQIEYKQYNGLLIQLKNLGQC